MFNIDPEDPTNLKMVGSPADTMGEVPVSVDYSNELQTGTSLRHTDYLITDKQPYQLVYLMAEASPASAASTSILGRGSSLRAPCGLSDMTSTRPLHRLLLRAPLRKSSSTRIPRPCSPSLRVTLDRQPFPAQWLRTRLSTGWYQRAQSEHRSETSSTISAQSFSTNHGFL